MKVIINIDGGSRGNPGIGASAYVIKDENGKILAQEGHYIPHCTNNQAEYTALRLALIKAAELGAKQLSIISDSLLLVKQYLGEYKIKNPDLAERMTEIRQLARPFHIQIQHVLRHLNKEPDALANKAMDLKQSVGFNPIQNLHPSSTNSTTKPQDNTVNGVPVEVVVRDEKGTAKKKKSNPAQPSLFDGF
ncbi:MAG: ribonuclease HI family protein [Elusimicrobiaceae bacterium]|nr:ribonuclease HI family protein [Elusimicrobiaceae bacterium]